MTVLTGWSIEQLEDEGTAFTEVIYRGLRESMVDTLSSLDNLVAATREPSPREKYTSKNPITPSVLSYITYYWNKFVDNTIKPWVIALFSRSAKNITDDVHLEWPTFNPTPFNPERNASAQRYIKASLDRLKMLGVELYERAVESLQVGMRENETIPQIRDRLMQTVELTRPRAESIARTEVVSSNNMSSLIQVQELGGTGTKTWLSKIDERTRETHRHADNQTVRINQQFQVGLSRLAFPGDPTGAIGEVINCRCTLTFDIDYFDLENSVLRS